MLAAGELSPEFCFEILLRRSDLADARMLAVMRDEQILSILNQVDENGQGDLLRRVLTLERPNLSDALVQHYPLALLSAADIAWNGSGNGELSSSTTNVLWKHRERILQSGALQSIKTTQGLACVANIFDYDDYKVLKVGSSPWISAVISSVDNAIGERRITFQAFLIAVAIRDPQPSVGPLLQFLYPTLREAIMGQGLPYRAERILNARLPSLGWSNWDLNQRLTIAIAQISREADLPRQFHKAIALPESEEATFLTTFDAGRGYFW
jgi:hypothetical protein